MPIQILNQDITALSCDVIVNPTDERFSGSGGVDRAVHQAAGRRLRKACDRLPPLAAGEVCYTKGYKLNSRYIIHTVGPRWKGGEHNEAALLRSCYTKALALSERLGARSVAFPLISSGTFGFPKNRVLRIALDAITDHLQNVTNEPDVTLCVLNRDAYSLEEADRLRAFLSEPSTIFPTEPIGFSAAFAPMGERSRPPQRAPFEEEPKENPIAASTEFDTAPVPKLPEEDFLFEYDSIETDEYLSSPASKAAVPKKRLKREKIESATQPSYAMPAMHTAEKPRESLEEWLKKQDDSFAVTLLKLIDKKGMTDVECYKRSNVSRKTFSKINTQKNYKPSKQTVLAFAVGLQLTLEETETLLRSAGFSLSRSYTADKIVEYFIRSGNYDIFEINAALYQYDQVLLGC